MEISTLRPGLLLSLKTTVSGNVKYSKKELEPEHLDADGALVELWETEKAVQKPDEHKEALQIRNRARTLIVGPCANTSFGLLCPESKANELGDAIIEAQNLAARFNERSELTRINVNVIIGRVAQDDVQAVKAINSEVRDLMDRMEAGVQALDVTAIRDAAQKAKNVGSMLSYDASERVLSAVKVARSAARKIVKAAESGAAEIDQATLTKIRQARTAFLDLDEREQTTIAPEAATGRAIDLTQTVAIGDVAHTASLPDLAAPVEQWNLECGPYFCVFVGPQPSQEEARKALETDAEADIGEDETVTITRRAFTPGAKTRQLDLGVEAD